MGAISGEFLGQSGNGCLISVAGVDLNTSNATNLYTVPAGKNCIITGVIIRNVSTSLTLASFGFGFDANASDVISSALHTALTGNTLGSLDVPKAGAVIGTAGSIFKVKCTILQGGAATATMDVLGYLL